MATKPKAAVEETPIPTPEDLDTDVPPADDDDIPEEYTTATKANNGVYSSGLTLEDLNTPVDTSARERDYNAINPPSGDWEKVERWQFDVQKDAYIKEGDCVEGDYNPKGRLFLNFKGYCKPRVENGIEYSPEFRVRIAWDKRLKAEPQSATDYDTWYKLYLDACEIYLAIHSEAVTRPSQIIKLFSDDSFMLRSMKGDNGPFVIQLKAKKTVRGSTKR